MLRGATFSRTPFNEGPIWPPMGTQTPPGMVACPLPPHRMVDCTPTSPRRVMCLLKIGEDCTKRERMTIMITLEKRIWLICFLGLVVLLYIDSWSVDVLGQKLFSSLFFFSTLSKLVLTQPGTHFISQLARSRVDLQSPLSHHRCRNERTKGAQRWRFSHDAPIQPIFSLFEQN